MYWATSGSQLSNPGKLRTLLAKAHFNLRAGDSRKERKDKKGQKVCHPVVIVKVNGMKCRALLDTGATGSYISAFLVDLLKVKPSSTLTRGIKTIMGLVTKRIETYDVKISDTQEKCIPPACATKIEQRELLSLENPDYPELMEIYPYLKGVQMKETDTKRILPIHVTLGANEYTKIKMAGYQRAGAMGEP